MLSPAFLFLCFLVFPPAAILAIFHIMGLVPMLFWSDRRSVDYKKSDRN